MPYTGHDDYLELQDRHWQTHAFRVDARFNEVLNVAMVPGEAPLGNVEKVEIEEYLLLAARAIQWAMLLWLFDKQPIVKANKKLMFWGQADDALLLRAPIKTGHGRALKQMRAHPKVRKA